MVPVLFLEGLSGSFFRPLVLSYGLAVLVSMLVALTVTPALCLLLLSRGTLVSARVAAAAGAEARVRRVLLRFLVRRPARRSPPACCSLAGVAGLPDCSAPSCCRTSRSATS